MGVALMVKILDPTLSNVMEVDPTLCAAIVDQWPMENLTWLSFGLKIGPFVISGSNQILFSLLYTGPNVLAVRRFGVGAVCTAWTAASLFDLGLFVARGYTTVDSGGSSLVLSGNNGKHRTSMAALTGAAINWSTSSALTAGSRNLDDFPIGYAGMYLGTTSTEAIGTIIPPAPDNLIGHNEGDYPLLLATNEGLELQAGIAATAGNTNAVYVNFEIAEIAGF